MPLEPATAVPQRPQWRALRDNGAPQDRHVTAGRLGAEAPLSNCWSTFSSKSASTSHPALPTIPAMKIQL
jgi:hypothetical protein